MPMRRVLIVAFIVQAIIGYVLLYYGAAAFDRTGCAIVHILPRANPLY